MEQAARGIVAANAIAKEFGKRILPKEAPAEPPASAPTAVPLQRTASVNEQSEVTVKKKREKLANPWVLRYFFYLQ